MPTQYIKIWDNHGQELLVPLTYSIVGKKYVYGPEANGKRRKRPEPLHIPWWQKVFQGYVELCRMMWRERS